MTDPIKMLAALAAEAGIDLNDDMLARFGRYSELLREWNERMNLTAITDERDIAVKHFYDSLLLLTEADIPKGASVIDIGTGAGFPGVVLKIARPDIKLTLMDSLAKRLTFLEALLGELGLDAALIHSRAEDGASGELRESFDIATARAVAALPVLCEYCLPYVKPGGSFVALKGPSAAEELTLAKKAIDLLGGADAGISSRKLPSGDERCFVTVKKKSQTPTKYPRNSAKIAKFPL